jgi:hypothetical protein
MKRISFLGIMIIIFLFALNGCSGGDRRNDPSSYMTGTEGVSISFVTNNPPSNVWVDNTNSEEIPIEIEAFNRGTYAAGNIEMSLVGFDQSIVSADGFSGISFDGTDGYKTRYNPEGGYDSDSANMNIVNMQDSDTYQFTLKLVYCYDYETTAAIQICVDPNPNKEARDDACVASTSVSTSGQGAPIGISSIEAEPMPGNVRLKINVKHYGQGQVLKGGTQCEGVPNREDENYVEFTTTPTLGDITGTCITESPVKLRSGQASIICNFPLDKEKSAYKTILNMKLFDYRIKDTVQKDIRIINEQNQN